MIKESEYTKQVMHKATVTDAQPVPEERALASLPPSLLLSRCHVLWYIPLVSCSAVLAVSPHTFLCPSSLLSGRAQEAERFLA